MMNIFLTLIFMSFFAIAVMLTAFYLLDKYDSQNANKYPGAWFEAIRKFIQRFRK